MSDLEKFYQLLCEAYGAVERADAFDLTPDVLGLIPVMQRSRNADALKLVEFVEKNLESLKVQLAAPVPNKRR